MRNEEVVIAFSHREIAKSSTGSLWSTGDCLYSYHTCIAEYDEEGKLIHCGDFDWMGKPIKYMK